MSWNKQTHEEIFRMLLANWSEMDIEEDFLFEITEKGDMIGFAAGGISIWLLPSGRWAFNTKKFDAALRKKRHEEALKKNLPKTAGKPE